MEFRAAAQLASMSDADAEPQFPSILAPPPPVTVEDSELRRLEKGGEERAAARSAFVAQMARRRSSVSIEAAVKTDSAGGASSPTDAPVQRRRSKWQEALEATNERALSDKIVKLIEEVPRGKRPRRHLRALAALLGRVAWFQPPSRQLMLMDLCQCMEGRRCEPGEVIC